MDAPDFSPDQVYLGGGVPLVMTFGRSELECAAALYILACRDLGGWASIPLRTCGEVINARVPEGIVTPEVKAAMDPDLTWLINPFIGFDFHGLVERGFMTFTFQRDGGKWISPTPSFFEKLARYVDRSVAA